MKIKILAALCAFGIITGAAHAAELINDDLLVSGNIESLGSLTGSGLTLFPSDFSDETVVNIGAENGNLVISEESGAPIDLIVGDMNVTDEISNISDAMFGHANGSLQEQIDDVFNIADWAATEIGKEGGIGDKLEDVLTDIYGGTRRDGSTTGGALPAIFGEDGLADQLADAQDDIVDLDDRLTTAEGDIADLKDADIALDGRLDTAETTLDDHETRLTTAESDINALESDLAAETTARENADTTLQANIDAEKLARENADDALNARLTTAEDTIADHSDAIQDISNDLYGKDGEEGFMDYAGRRIDELQEDADEAYAQATLATEKIWGSASDPHGIVNGPNGEGMLGDMTLLSGGDNIKDMSRDSDYISMTDAVLSLDEAIGDRTYTEENVIASGESVAESLDAIDQAIGDVSRLADRTNVHPTAGTGKDHAAHHTDGMSLTDALIATEDKLDSLVRRETNSSGHNIIHLGENSIELNEVTGDISHNANGTSATPLAIRTISALDGQFHDVATMDQIDRLDNSMNELTDEVRTGLASVNAMSALVPNARSSGDTQVSFGTGGYRDAVGVAAGVFHYVSDGTLLNAGVSYGTGKTAEVGWRAGVTFGF
ncbi:MAG: YadA-like family protein [Rickettsiales bacterium]|jgi:hypothetical protein|nr:YadA-like family protein [Rickettsiales bacterium]